MGSLKTKQLPITLFVNKELKIKINILTGILDSKFKEIIPELLEMGITEYLKQHPEIASKMNMLLAEPTINK